jgi:inositol phosphorylceramide mannosyltransferase catalytic subunit
VVPRTLHFVWLDEEIPPQRQACIDSCIAMHPGWDVRIWRDVSEFGPLRNGRAFHAASELAPSTWPHARYQIASNVLRFEVMLRHGGLFFDTDITCLRSLEPLIERVEAEGKAGMLGWEIERKWLGEAVIAAVPGAPFMERIVSHLEPWAFARAGKAATITVGPQYVTPLLRGSKELRDVLVMPQRAFFPARHNQPDLGDSLASGKAHPDTYAVHGFHNFRRKQALGLV